MEYILFLMHIFRLLMFFCEHGCMGSFIEYVRKILRKINIS